MNVIVCGTRGAVQPYVEWNLGNELFELSPSCIFHGRCYNSADMLADQWAHDHGVDVEVYPAHWESHGKAAGFMRNSEMAEVVASNGGGYCVAVWDGKSRGTLHMIQESIKREIPVTIIPAKVS